MFKKIPKKFHDKTVQSYMLWLNLNKIDKFFFYNQHINKVTPHSTFMRRAQKRRYPCTQTASAVPKYFPCLLQFLYWLSHLTCISNLKAENERKTFTQLKISRYNQHFFAIFRPIFYKLTSDLFTVV